MEEKFKKAAQFATLHADADCDRLLLNAGKYPDTDIPLAVNTITARKKLRSKVPEWAAANDLVFPSMLATEQCSSDKCAAYKASVIQQYHPESVADLTGGMGIDDYYISRVCGKIHYFERQPVLCSATGYNFRCLGVSNATFDNLEITADNIIGEVIERYRPQLIYIDPARRGRQGERVFSLKDYEPDIFGLKDEILERVPVMIVKISPMEDPDAIFAAIPECREIHIISVANECKELLLVIERGFSGEPAERMRKAVSISEETVFSYQFTKNEEAKTVAPMIKDTDEIKEGMLIADPNKSMLKAGGYNVFSKVCASRKLDVSTHLYLCDGMVKGAGRYFRVVGVYGMNKQGLKDIAAAAPVAEISVKNLPLSTDGLRKKLKIKAGGTHHIWGCRAAGTNILILTVPVRN